MPPCRGLWILALGSCHSPEAIFSLLGPFSTWRLRRLVETLLLAARLFLRDPWLCVPASRRVCLCRGQLHNTRAMRRREVKKYTWSGLGRSNRWDASIIRNDDSGTLLPCNSISSTRQ